MSESRDRSIWGQLWIPDTKMTLTERISYRLAVIPLPGLAIVLLAPLTQNLQIQRFGEVLVLVCLLFMAVGGTLALLSSSNKRKLTKQHDYKLCIKCRHPLDDLPKDGLCPDCGDQYNHEELRKYWKPSKRFKRAKRRFKLYIYGTVIVWIITFFLRFLFLLPNIPIGVSIYSHFIPLFALIGLAIGLAISIRARCKAKRYNFLVCPECMYPMAKDKEIQVCPECGTKMYATEVIDYWQSWGKAKTPNFNHLGPVDD